MTLSTEMEILSKSSPSVVELTQELMEYKISIYIFYICDCSRGYLGMDG